MPTDPTSVLIVDDEPHICDVIHQELRRRGFHCQVVSHPRQAQKLLARSGVAPRTAQELMRHSDIRLTTNIYQHLELIDTASAVETLPNLEDCRVATATAAGA
jgi:DNA-binding NtrC family response regulator